MLILILTRGVGFLEFLAVGIFVLLIAYYILIWLINTIIGLFRR